ncbi:unnamed protein product [Lampetra planeri]
MGVAVFTQQWILVIPAHLRPSYPGMPHHRQISQAKQASSLDIARSLRMSDDPAGAAPLLSAAAWLRRERPGAGGGGAVPRAMVKKKPIAGV